MSGRDSRQIEEEAAAWLAHRDSDAWTDRDEAGFGAWIATSTAHRVAFLRLESAWGESARLRALGAGIGPDTIPPRNQWSGLPGIERVDSHDSRGTPDAGGTSDAVAPPAGARRLWTARAGAAIAVLIVGGALGWGWRAYVASEDASYATAAGEMRTIALADGSTVTLSSGTAIDVRLARRERHIDLRQGEAFFSVAHDTRRPFSVAVGARRAVAVGTSFAVRRDPDEMRIVVTEGVVRFDLQSADPEERAPSTLLTAGAVATARGNSVLVRAGSVADAERSLSWRSGYLSFHDTPLATAAAEFNRYGPPQLVIGDAAVGQVRVGGNFRWSNIEAFARLLEDGFGIRVERQDDRIVLHSP